MKLLRALDRAFTTFINEIYPFPVFPDLDALEGESIERTYNSSAIAPMASPVESGRTPGVVKDPPEAAVAPNAASGGQPTEGPRDCNCDDTSDAYLYYPLHHPDCISHLDVIPIGPGCFAAKDGSVLCWQGVNYVPQK